MCWWVWGGGGGGCGGVCECVRLHILVKIILNLCGSSQGCPIIGINSYSLLMLVIRSHRIFC